MPTATIASLLLQAAATLEQKANPSPRLEAEILLAHVLDKSRSHLFAWPERMVEDCLVRRFNELVGRRGNGEPSAYLTGTREFWSLQLQVSRKTLIPRPETELLVEQTLHRLSAVSSPEIADLGTGSGAVSAALASERPHCRIVATDISAAALAIAQRNFKRLGLGSITCAQGSWFRALPFDARFDCIVSNPPYIASDDPHLLADGLAWEPSAALVAGTDGLDAIRSIIAGAQAFLQPEGWLLLEHGYDQGGRVRELLQESGYRHCATHRDLHGHPRVSEAMRPLESIGAG